MPRPIDKRLKAAIVADYLAGVKVSDISKRYGVSTTYPSALAARLGLPMRWTIERRRRMAAAAAGR